MNRKWLWTISRYSPTKTVNVCAEIQIWDLQLMNKIPNYISVKMHISCKHPEINSMGKYLDFQVNWECKILQNENYYDQNSLFSIINIVKSRRL
jgi:hypothetical protein